MAEPMLQIERRVENIELAIRIMAQEFLSGGAAARIELILRDGKTDDSVESSSDDSDHVRQEAG